MNKDQKEQMILSYITEYVKEFGFPPSIREICAALQIKSTSTVHAYISSLEEKGKLTRSKMKKRAMMPTDAKMKEYIEVPILGNIAAGQPILAEENIQDTFPLPMYFAKSNEIFMLKIKGDSMIEAGILDGDYVMIRQQDYAENGDMVAALIDQEATVKTFYKEKDGIRLQPENAAYPPIYTKDLRILGKVIGVYRIY